MKPEFLELFRALEGAEVEHVVVGGVAAILEGAPIATLDLDIVYRPDRDNLHRFVTLLEKLESRTKTNRLRDHNSPLEVKLKRLYQPVTAIAVSSIAALCGISGTAYAADLVHDAEYYILEAQNGERWAVEDAVLDAKLAELRAKYGTPPNIIHVMWDDTSFGDVGIPAINKIRGFETPSLNRLAEEGIMFTRMYTEVGRTPSRAAVLTGRHAVRSGMDVIGFPVEYSGMRGEEVITAEVLSDAGYATAL